MVVHDALTMGPAQGPDDTHPAHEAAGRRRRRAILVRTGECLAGSVEVELVCEPAFDYGRQPAEWSLVDEGRTPPMPRGAGQTLRLQLRHGARAGGQRRAGRHALAKGERAFCALSWAEELASPSDADDAAREDRS